MSKAVAQSVRCRRRPGARRRTTPRRGREDEARLGPELGSERERGRAEETATHRRAAAEEDDRADRDRRERSRPGLGRNRRSPEEVLGRQGIDQRRAEAGRRAFEEHRREPEERRRSEREDDVIQRMRRALPHSREPESEREQERKRVRLLVVLGARRSERRPLRSCPRCTSGPGHSRGCSGPRSRRCPRRSRCDGSRRYELNREERQKTGGEGIEEALVRQRVPNLGRAEPRAREDEKKRDLGRAGGKKTERFLDAVGSRRGKPEAEKRRGENEAEGDADGDPRPSRRRSAMLHEEIADHESVCPRAKKTIDCLRRARNERLTVKVEARVQQGSHPRGLANRDQQPMVRTIAFVDHLRAAGAVASDDPFQELPSPLRARCTPWS